MINEAQWNQISGLSFDGKTFKELLDQLIAGTLSSELKDELLVDCCRDGAASTAGYAAIPLLLHAESSPRLGWELAWTAGQTLAEGAMRDAPPVPEFLKENVRPEMVALAIRKLQLGLSLADLSLIEQIQTISLIAALRGRQDLADQLTRIALLESGMPREYVDANYPDSERQAPRG
jgi:hypothetical protein